MKFLSNRPFSPDCKRGVAHAIVASIVVCAAFAQTGPSLLPASPDIRQAAAVAASAVPPEQAQANIAALSGEYSYGNGFDMNCTLEISPDGRFLYKKCSCERVVDQAAGMVRLDNGHVVLNPAEPHKDWPKGTSSVLIPVSWGQRLYLVPQNDIVGFSNQVNRGVEPVTRGSMGNYYLREGDWDRPATGKPDLPDEWKDRLLDEPVTGLIAGRDPSNRWIINLGKDHGVYDGMELSAWSLDLRKFVTLIVTETGSHTSAVQIVGAPPNLAIQGWIVYSKITPPNPIPVIPKSAPATQDKAGSSEKPH